MKILNFLKKSVKATLVTLAAIAFFIDLYIIRSWWIIDTVKYHLGIDGEY
jgi:presenilin-like A22 family membrane protease